MLPMHARPTASRAIKNNTKITESITEPNMITNMEKVSNHLKHHNRMSTCNYEVNDKNCKPNAAIVGQNFVNFNLPTTDSNLSSSRLLDHDKQNTQNHDLISEIETGSEPETFIGEAVIYCPKSSGRIINYINNHQDYLNRIFKYDKNGEVSYFNQVK